MNQYKSWLRANDGPSSNRTPTVTTTAAKPSGYTHRNAQSFPTSIQSETPPIPLQFVTLSAGDSGTSTNPPLSAPTPGAGSQPPERQIFWCINLNQSLTVMQSLKVTVADSHKDRNTFLDLRIEYFRTRGRRGRLSLYTISAIELVKVLHESSVSVVTTSSLTGVTVRTLQT